MFSGPPELRGVVEIRESQGVAELVAEDADLGDGRTGVKADSSGRIVNRSIDMCWLLVPGTGSVVMKDAAASPTHATSAR